MFWIKKYFIFIAAVLIILPATGAAQNGQISIFNGTEKDELSDKAIQERASELRRPVLAITPREKDLGTITSGETVAGFFTLKNMGYGMLGWSTGGPEGWEVAEKGQLSSIIEDDADYLRIEIRVLAIEKAVGLNAKISSYPVEIKLSAGTSSLFCQKQLALGVHKEAIKINSIGGSRTIFVAFKIVSTEELAQINLNPMRMDMGNVLAGKIVSKRIRLTNKGKEILRWSIASPKQKRGDPLPETLKNGRYISFANEMIRGTAAFEIPGYLKDTLTLTGRWAENDGYPSSRTSGNALKFQFTGTGLILYFVTYPYTGKLAVYLDDLLINKYEWFTEKKESGELLVAEGLADGPHAVTLVHKEGNIDIEGVKVWGKEVLRGPAGWMTIFPDSGSTTMETEYINVTLNTAQLTPGIYVDNILFSSNGGEGIVEVFLEVVPDKTTKSIDVYRYARGFDFLFTANPQKETKRLSQNGYVKEGIAFRLFVADTPGTIGFYRWYNPQKKGHFYHYDLKGGGKKLDGYVFEGVIGNIATSKMTNTKELYRWYNPTTSHYFYTTDPKGEKVAKKGYKFDGIAGYVK